MRPRRDRNAAEDLDRALYSASPEVPSGVAGLTILGKKLADDWAVSPDPQAVEHGRRIARAAFRAATARDTRRGRVLRRGLVAAAAAAVVIAAGSAAAVPIVSGAQPGDATYPAKLAAERVRLVLAADEAGEASLYLAQAETRFEEALRVQREGRTDVLPASLRRYTEAVTAFEDSLRQVPAEQETGLREEAGTRFDTHQRVLAALLDTVPEAARPGIQRAIEASRDADGPPAGRVPDEPGPPATVGPPQDVPPGRIPMPPRPSR